MAIELGQKFIENAEFQVKMKARKKAISAKRKQPDSAMADCLIDGYKFMSASERYRFAQRVAQFHDNTCTRSPFGGA